MRTLVLLALLLFTIDASSQVPGLTCRELATAAGNLAVDRDHGVPIDEARSRMTRSAAHALLNDGLRVDEIAPAITEIQAIVRLVYETEGRPRELQDLVQNNCLRGVLRKLRGT